MNRGRQAGLSLVELLVSSAIGLLVVAAAGKLYVDSKINRQVQSELEGMQQNARFALNQIVKDAKRSGYFGEFTELSSLSGTQAPVIPDGSCSIVSNSWGRMLQQPLFGLNESRAGYDCIPERDYLRGDVLTLRYAVPSPVTASEPLRLYLKTSPEAGRLFVGHERDDAANRIATGHAVTRALVARTYYIRESSTVTCPDGSHPPSLYREYLGNDGLPVSEEVAAGIENLQIEYGITESSQDNLRFVDADAVDDWESVVMLQLWLLARQECPHAAIKPLQRQYPMGEALYTPGDARFLRELFQATIMLRNRPR